MSRSHRSFRAQLGIVADRRGRRQRAPSASGHNSGVSTSTPAIHFLCRHGVPFVEHVYRYEDRGGTRVSARELGVDEHAIVKTLVMEDERQKPMLVLMHGDREVSTKQLARQTGRKTVSPCDPAVAQKHTGYMVGGTSPFGTRKTLPVYLERSILALERVYINGGRRGFLVAMSPQDIARVLQAVVVDVALTP
jgi:Cys-tRNA(Pro) deacylase